MAMSKKKKSRIITGIIGFLIVTIGLVALNYPYLAGVVNKAFAHKEAEVYIQEIQQMDTTELDARIKRAHEYNHTLAVSGNLSLFEDFDMVQEGTLLGYLEVPQIDVYMSVRYSVSNEVLKHSLGLVEDSSLPVGGESTHAVISGHTGMASKKVLTDLTQMKEGDVFFIHSLGMDLAYKVDQILVVEPWDSSALQIVPDKDYVTLLTCTPYGVNSHRLLVRGERIEYDFTAPVEVQPIVEERISDVERTRMIIAYVSAAAFVLLIIFVIVYISDPKSKKKRKAIVKNAKILEHQKEAEASVPEQAETNFTNSVNETQPVPGANLVKQSPEKEGDES